MSSANSGRSIGSGGSITDDAAFAKTCDAMEVSPITEPDRRAAEPIHAQTPHAAKVRAKCHAELAHLVGDYDARTIVEMLSGSCSDAHRSTIALVRIIDRALTARSARDGLIKNAEILRAEGDRAMRSSREMSFTDPRSAGAMRGIAWCAYDDAAQALEWAGQVGCS